MTRRSRKRYTSPYTTLANILGAVASMMDTPRKLRKRLETITLEQVKIEQGKLKVQQEQARIAKENNAVLLQDLEIELKKLQIIEKQRALGVNDSEIDPPFWNG